MTEEKRYIITGSELQIFFNYFKSQGNPLVAKQMGKIISGISSNHSSGTDAGKVLEELMGWICSCDGGDVVFNPKLGLFSSPQPFNTIGLIQKIIELRQGKKS